MSDNYWPPWPESEGENSTPNISDWPSWQEDIHRAWYSCKNTQASHEWQEHEDQTNMQYTQFEQDHVHYNNLVL